MNVRITTADCLALSPLLSLFSPSIPFSLSFPPSLLPSLPSLPLFRLKCNIPKNRYKDVVCYDNSRVMLETIPGVEVRNVT